MVKFRSIKMNRTTYGIIIKDGKLIEYPVRNDSIVASDVDSGNLIQIIVESDGTEIIKLFSTCRKDMLWSEQVYTCNNEIVTKIRYNKGVKVTRL